MPWNRDYIRKKLSSKEVQKIICHHRKTHGRRRERRAISTEEIIRLGEIVATMATTLHEADKHHLAEVKKRKKRDLFAKREG